MRLSRFVGIVGIVDLGIITVVLVTLVLPAREMLAGPAVRGDAEARAIALAEARTMARPDDGAAVDDLARRLGAAGFNDWAIEVATRGSERAPASPTRWRALLAASVALVDRSEVKPALELANRAIAACTTAGAACPEFERARMDLYQQQLDAGVKSGIDPKQGPEAARAFRQAQERALRQIHVGGGSPGPAGSGTRP